MSPSWWWACHFILLAARPVQSLRLATSAHQSRFQHNVSLYSSGDDRFMSKVVACKQQEEASVVIDRHKRLGFTSGKIPIWVVYQYKPDEKSPIVDLSLKALRMHAPADRFDIRLVNSSNAHNYIPDLPRLWQKLPDFGSKSDLLRAGFLAHHGGLYVDGDVLFVCDVQGMTDLLSEADLVTYAAQGQDVSKGVFASNTMAVRPKSLLAMTWWAQVKTQVWQACENPETYLDDLKNGVCCIQPDGHTERSRCHVPWAGLGERTVHPILGSMLSNASMHFQAAFFSEDRDKTSFAPDSAGQMLFRQLTGPPANDVCDHRQVVELHNESQNNLRRQYAGAPCWRPCNSTALVCSDGRSWENAYARFAYHLFEHACSPDVHASMSSDEALLRGDWVVSEFFRMALGIDPLAEA